MSKGEKVALIATGVEIVLLLGISAVCYAKSEYYRGRIDVRKKMTEEIKELRSKLAQAQLSKEEA